MLLLVRLRKSVERVDALMDIPSIILDLHAIPESNSRKGFSR